MKVVGLVVLLLVAVVNCYIETEPNENRILATMPFKTMFFLRRLTPYSSRLDKPLPMGAHRRLDSQERFSPFHSVLVIKKPRNTEDSMGMAMQKAEFGESFIRDFLVSHLQHVNSLERSNQFNTEKIYEDMLKRAKHAQHVAHKPSHRGGILADEIDSIIADAAKEITPSIEEIQSNGSLGKKFTKTRKRVGKSIKSARKKIGKRVKLNTLTIILFVVIGVISGFAGYFLRGKSALDNYIPLDK